MLIVFPNPFKLNNNLKFDLSKYGTHSETINAQLLDFTGRVVLSKSFKTVNNQAELSIDSGIHNGMYYLILKDNYNKTIHTQKLTISF